MLEALQLRRKLEVPTRYPDRSATARVATTLGLLDELLGPRNAIHTLDLNIRLCHELAPPESDTVI